MKKDHSTTNLVNIKLNYYEQLQLKIIIPQHFQIEKFSRHWLIIGGYSLDEQIMICKRYYSYLNDGDLIKIKTNNFQSCWRQKNNKIYEKNDKKYNFIDQFTNILQIQNVNIKKIPIQINQNTLDWIQNIYQEDKQQQMRGLKTLSILLNINSGQQFITDLLQKFKQLNNQNLLVNLFYNITESLLQVKQKYVFIDKWLMLYQNSSIQSELKYYFFKLNKINIKKIHIELKCRNGDLVRKAIDNEQCNQMDISQWRLEKNTLSLDMHYPSCNKIYIHQIRFRNLGLLGQYQFEFSLYYQDLNDQEYSSFKAFTLKPIRGVEYKSIKCHNNQQLDLKQLDRIMNIQNSVSCQSFQFIEKLSAIKQICEIIQIDILNNMGFRRQDQQKWDSSKQRQI